VHHSTEESTLFPQLEEMAGVKGIMDANVEQHHAFTEGMDAFSAYLQGVVANRKTYDGARIQKLIDAFGATLVRHLHDEIPTLLSLRQYGLEKMATLQEKCDDEGKKNMVSPLSPLPGRFHWSKYHTGYSMF
jgi:hypothetical protein